MGTGLTAHASFTPEVLGSGLSQGPKKGGELGFAYIAEPLSDRWIYAGPRVMATYLRESSSNYSKLNLAVGGEATIWLVNAIGPGLAIDYLINDQRVRIESNLGIRFLHLGEDSAMALRMGLFHDPHDELGLKLGITLQFGGVSSLDTAP